jgi:GntR family transcriptional regulator
MRKIDRPAKPLYELAKEQLMEMLSQFEVGDRFPSEEVLSREMGISRNTLREATKIMLQKGWLVQRQGSGTFVAKQPRLIDSGLETLKSLDSVSRRNEWSYTSDHLNIKRRIADRELCKKLQLAEGASVTEVSQVTVVNGQKVAFLTDIVPHDVMSEDELRGSFKGSVLELLKSDKRHTIDFAYTEIKVTSADNLADLLEIDKNAHLLLTIETVHATNGKILEYALNYMVPDFFQFHVIRRLSNDD